MTSIRAAAPRRAPWVAALTFAACATQAPPPAQAPPPPQVQPAREMSTVVIPIRMDLDAVAHDVDTRIPSRFSATQRQSGIDVSYDVSRDPIRISMIGAGLHSSTTIRYSIEACRGRFPCVSCGRKEPPREAEITLHTALQWDASWRLRSTTRLLPVSYPRRCEVTWFDFDVTGRYVAPVIEQQLASAAALIDRELPAATNLRPAAAQVWDLLQKPYSIAPRTWLVLEPSSVALSPVRGNGSTAQTALQLQAFTRVVLGDAPQAQRTPLPALRATAPAGEGLRIPFDLVLPYAEASQLAMRDYGGKTYKVDGRDLRVEDLRLQAGAPGKIQLIATIDYRGGTLRKYRGSVVLEGTPQLEPGTSSVVVPDLDYSLDARRGNPFLRAGERAAHENVRTNLRRAARFELGAQLAAARTGLNQALNRRLAPGVELRGSVASISATAVNALPEAVSVRFVATGTAEVQTGRR